MAALNAILFVSLLRGLEVLREVDVSIVRSNRKRFFRVNSISARTGFLLETIRKQE